VKRIHTVDLEDLYLFIQQMHQKGIHIPKNKENGGILDVTPSGRLDKTPPPQPVNEKRHGYGEQDMGNLMHIQPLGPSVALCGKDGGWDENQANPERMVDDFSHIVSFKNRTRFSVQVSIFSVSSMWLERNGGFHFLILKKFSASASGSC
jgi:hypothetical protein